MYNKNLTCVRNHVSYVSGRQTCLYNKKNQLYKMHKAWNIKLVQGTNNKIKRLMITITQIYFSVFHKNNLAKSKRSNKSTLLHITFDSLKQMIKFIPHEFVLDEATYSYYDPEILFVLKS